MGMKKTVHMSEVKMFNGIIIFEDLIQSEF